tara:strand:+ start:1705 stop:1887 length:183 start_codon:yes stop_codon:yes gene_type:complete
MLKILSGIAMATGLLIMAGSAGDCDGACIDQANSMSEMITYVTIGLSLFAGGAITLIKSA